MIRGIHHVQITIPKNAEQEARRFYCDMLGMNEIEKPDALKPRGGFWLAVGELQLHVGTEDGIERDQTKAHVAYHVDNLDHWQRRLSSCGIDIVAGIPIPGFDRFEFRDPFGNRVEIISDSMQRSA